jgi:ABC-type multidrug transport system ATPase subunit
MAEPLIQVDGLSKLYGRFRALDQISLSVGSNEFVAILGRNGAGKTTFLKILSLLLRPSQGHLTVAGLPASKSPNAILRQTGMVSHQVYLYNDLTAWENLYFYARLYDVDGPAAVIDALLERVGLAARAREPVRRFSRGMLQRLSLARVLLHKPRILLLDEPYTGLDQKASLFLDEMLREYHRAGHCLLMVSHDIDHAVSQCERAVVFDRGKLVLDSPTAGRPELPQTIRGFI